MVRKRFPASVTLSEETFLNDKLVDGELYAYFQTLSVKKVLENGECETRVYFDKIPSQVKICEAISIGSPKTYRKRLNYLIEQGYLTKKEDYYVLNNKEEFYLLIPLDTLNFLLDVFKEYIIKIYVYLGQQFFWKKSQGYSCYEFTSQEVAEHIGLKTKGNSRTYEVIRNALDALDGLGLIRYVSYFDGGCAKKKLLNFNLELQRRKD